MENLQPKILIVTPTYERIRRILYIKRLIKIFRNIRNILWIIVEDADRACPEVERLLKKSGIAYIYLNTGPTSDFGNLQRDFALRYIRDRNLEGIVYLADDDNYYDEKLFDEIRKTKNVSVFPVGNLGPHGIEKPIVQGGKILEWDAGWKERKFPVDMAGFAFNTRLLKPLSDPVWSVRKVRGGETEFLEKIVNSKDELETLCDNCKECLVVHNKPLGWNMACALALRRIKKYYQDFLSKN